MREQETKDWGLAGHQLGPQVILAVRKSLGCVKTTLSGTRLYNATESATLKSRQVSEIDERDE